MIVLFIDGDASLLLRGEEYDKSGNLRFGDVVNGLWRLEIKDGEFLAKFGNFIVNRWSVPYYEIMQIDDGVRSNYNDIMDRARQKYDPEKVKGILNK